MSVFTGLSLLLTCAFLICCCNCQDSFVSLMNRLDQFEEELLNNKINVLHVKQKVFNMIEVAKVSLKSELKESIREQMREVMAETLEGDSLRDMLKSEVASALRHVKRGYHQMKRQIHHVSKSFKDFKDETTVFHEWNDTKSDICVIGKHRLRKSVNLKADVERIIALNETCESRLSRLSQLKTALDVSTSSQTARNVIPTTSPLVSMTPRLGEKRSRILISPFWSYVQNEFLQFNIENKSLTAYQYHSLSSVMSVEYIAKTNKLLIGLYNTDKILSSTLDTDHVKVLKRGVAATSMAADEDRDIVFMSTYQPRLSISRMSLKGKNFTTIIDLSSYGGIPGQIALDTKAKKIYGCNENKLFTVGYDGQGLATLATGRTIRAVILDHKTGALYYNIGRTLMNMTVSNNVSTGVTSLRAYPRNMRLYRGIIYYGGYDPSIVGAVNVTHNTIAYTLQYVRMIGANDLQVCLIP
ncbi:uncharacterized protein [Haliotis asinina]|uniref:uncharacterized protein n=1 Tax=Haliotis asinina TaxID=109174 RepID=UPI0035323659